MPFNFNRYSGLLLIFFVHGLVYALLLLRKGIRQDRKSDLWLALFLFLCILYICPWMLGYAGWYNGNLCMECRNFMFYMPLQHTLLMGPVIYFYIQSLLNPAFSFTRKNGLHLLPPALYILWNIIVFVTDRLVLKKYFLMDGQNDPDFQPWYLAVGLISLLCYLLLCIRYYNNYRRFIVQELSFADSVTFQWVRNFLMACFIYFLSSLFFDVLSLFGIANDTRQTWWYYLLFAILFYYIAITGYTNSIETKVSYQLDFLKYKGPLLLTAAGVPAVTTEDISYEEIIGPVEGNPSTATDYSSWKEKVIELVVHQRRYSIPELTLSDLAREMNTNPSLLSKVINQSLGMNFNDFINYHRVNEVKAKLQDPAFAHLTIMSIAYEAGFNSKATFNRAFKKLTGENPRAFVIPK